MNPLPHILCLIFLLTGDAHGNDSTGKGDADSADNAGVVPVSFAEVVERIRHRHKSWQILDARSSRQESGLRYRFKLINSSGQVRIILIDPRNPNLGYPE